MNETSPEAESELPRISRSIVVASSPASLGATGARAGRGVLAPFGGWLRGRAPNPAYVDLRALSYLAFGWPAGDRGAGGAAVPRFAPRGRAYRGLVRTIRREVSRGRGSRGSTRGERSRSTPRPTAVLRPVRVDGATTSGPPAGDARPRTSPVGRTDRVAGPVTRTAEPTSPAVPAGDDAPVVTTATDAPRVGDPVVRAWRPGAVVRPRVVRRDARAVVRSNASGDRTDRGGRPASPADDAAERAAPGGRTRPPNGEETTGFGTPVDLTVRRASRPGGEARTATGAGTARTVDLSAVGDDAGRADGPGSDHTAGPGAHPPSAGEGAAATDAPTFDLSRVPNAQVDGLVDRLYGELTRRHRIERERRGR